eukprot:TRINITY_DN32580_c0_g1_i1.p1 TRINITY_DN32580_c0_g1~~TRINITY_DN32580_c0_g1_i1.p1  ORF type:complete len:360 (+),score=47.70 TRINITY_DN32580_c0_g1_i1:84-1163(+)
MACGVQWLSVACFVAVVSYGFRTASVSRAPCEKGPDQDGSAACDGFFDHKLALMKRSEVQSRVRQLLCENRLLMHVDSQERFCPRTYQDEEKMLQCGHATVSTTLLGRSKPCIFGTKAFLIDANLCSIWVGAKNQNSLRSSDGEFTHYRYRQSYSDRSRFVKTLLDSPKETRGLNASLKPDAAAKSRTASETEVRKPRSKWIEESQILLTQQAAALFPRKSALSSVKKKMMSALKGGKTDTKKDQQEVKETKYNAREVLVLLDEIARSANPILCNEVLADCPAEAVVGAIELPPRAMKPGGEQIIAQSLEDAFGVSKNNSSQEHRVPKRILAQEDSQTSDRSVIDTLGPALLRMCSPKA